MRLRLPPRRDLKPVLPALVTLAAMACGFFSLGETLQDNLLPAAWLIAVAGLLDALDGPVARMLGAASTFGGELDSFADFGTFGIASSALFYRDFFEHWGGVGMALSFLPVVACAIRLARYNLTSDAIKTEYFTGFSSTANGCLLASFVLFSHDLWRFSFVSSVAVALVLLSSILMVSGVPYMKISTFTGAGVWKTPQGSLWIPIVLAVLLFPAKAFFPAMLIAMIQGPLGPRIDDALHHMPGIRR